MNILLLLALFAAEFQEEFNVSVSSPIIRSYALQENIIGICDPDTKVVTLNESYLLFMETNKLKKLVFHELAHCYLGMKHLETGIMKVGNALLPMSTKELNRQIKELKEQVKNPKNKQTFRTYSFKGVPCER
ncbi:hypothetical protein DRO61_07145 [Candidatus Bathyarchaeota archaeon]|nr:MAG: hypothetical protein DRO61_07145 [Candidatus Bathyarchaeota archaeon]